MRVVTKGEEVLNFPGVCAFTRDSEGPFLDTDTYLNARQLDGVDPYVYIHVQKVVDMGRAVGMVPKEDFEAIKERFDAQTLELDEIKKVVEALTTIKDAERVLTNA